MGYYGFLARFMDDIGQEVFFFFVFEEEEEEREEVEEKVEEEEVGEEEWVRVSVECRLNRSDWRCRREFGWKVQWINGQIDVWAWRLGQDFFFVSDLVFL